MILACGSDWDNRACTCGRARRRQTNGCFESILRERKREYNSVAAAATPPQRPKVCEHWRSRFGRDLIRREQDEC
jgi:hypothetical protein